MVFRVSRPLFCFFAALTGCLIAAAAAAQPTASNSELIDERSPDPARPTPEPSGLVVSANVAADGAGDSSADQPRWTVELHGYVRTQYTSIQDDPNYDAFGRHDGFHIADARFGFLGRLDGGLGFQLQVDAGDSNPSEHPNSAVGEVVTRLKDGYVFYQPLRLVRASAGQFKVPFGIEELVSTSDLLFIDRSVGNRGVLGIEGFDRDGLGVGRQVGVRVDSKPYFVLGADDGPGVSYAVAATNGASANRSLNDNDQLAYYGRLNLHWGDLVQVGGAAYHNEKTTGKRPDRLGQSETGWTADLTAQIHGFTLLANVIQVAYEPDEELGGEPDRTARSYQAQIAYEEPYIGIQAAYRLAYLNPNTDIDGDQAITVDQTLTHHTIGLNYNAQNYPIRVMTNYTITDEAVVSVDNNRFDALVQVQW